MRNVRAAGGHAYLRRGERREVRLEEVPPEGRAPIIQKYLRENALTTKRYFGIGPEAALADFEAIAPRHPVFRITYL